MFLSLPYFVCSFCYYRFQIEFVSLLLMLPNCICSFVNAVAKLYLFLRYCCCQIVFVPLLLLLPNCICLCVIAVAKLYLCTFHLLLQFPNWICFSNIAIAKLYMFMCYSCCQIVFVPLLLPLLNCIYYCCHIVFVPLLLLLPSCICLSANSDAKLYFFLC